MRPESPPTDEQVQLAVEDALRDSDKPDLITKTRDGETKLNGLLPLRMLLQEEILCLLAENPNAETMDDSIQLVPLHRILTAKSGLSLNDTSLGLTWPSSLRWVWKALFG
jgi:hypothetical protein